MDDVAALLRVAALFCVMVTVFVMRRYFHWTVLALAGVASLAGVVSLAWSASAGIWTDGGRVRFGSPEAETAFRVGMPAASLGLATFFVTLLRPDPSWEATRKGRMSDVAVRVIGTIIGSGMIGLVIYTLITGHIK